MNIKPLNILSYTPVSPFLKNKRQIQTSNLNFSSQKLPCDTFFISMEYYEKDQAWARKMVNLCDDITKMVENKEDFEKIMAIVAKETGEININKCIKDYMSRIKYDSRYELIKEMITKYYSDTYGTLKDRHSLAFYELSKDYKGEEYLKEYREACKKYPKSEFKVQSNKKYPDALTCTIKLLKNDFIKITYGKEKNNNNVGYRNVIIAKKAYEELVNKENPSLDEIMEATATIQWLISQSTPYNRGSASIANMVAKCIMNAYDIEVSPIKKGKSPDFEAFYRNLDDYIKIYPNLFEKTPKFIETT